MNRYRKILTAKRVVYLKRKNVWTPSPYPEPDNGNDTTIITTYICT